MMSDKDNKSPPPNSNRGGASTRTGHHSKMQNYSISGGAQASPRGSQPEKPLTPYEDRVIPTLRNTNKSRQEKFSTGGGGVGVGGGADYYNNGNEDEQLNNSGSENSKDNGGGTNGGVPSDSIVPDQQQQGEYEQEMYDPIDGTEEMTERELREAALMNDYLGKQIVTTSFLFNLNLSK